MPVLRLTIHDAIDDIDCRAWNALAGRDYPFLRHEFLSVAESSGSVSPATGWTPRHLTLSDENGLRAAMPLYEKSDSWGEFVFDWAWANAYQQAGLEYYPKLVSAIPFTPASSNRLLLKNVNDADAAASLLKTAINLARDSKCSSLHILFPALSEMPVLQDAGLLLRKDCQFHWHNNNYRSFDDFLDTFTSAKRKKARRDRRRVRESGTCFRRLCGADIDEQTLSTVYQLISRTFRLRGSTPYFNEEFFREISEQLADGILYVLAELDSTLVAAAVFFVGTDTLYGRYWGSDGHFDSLHFETCYYQGIDYCIENGIQSFEPGTQGEHKISRGFSPTETGSAHWLRHPQFSNAIERYLDEEGHHIDRYIEAVETHTPYKRQVEEP